MPRKRVQTTEAVLSGGASAAAAPAKKHRAARVNVKKSEPAGMVSSAHSPQSRPGQEEIARLAYSYWEARGYQGGSPEEDWLRAERELAASLQTVE